MFVKILIDYFSVSYIQFTFASEIRTKKSVVVLGSLIKLRAMANESTNLAMVVIPQSVWENVTKDLKEVKSMLTDRTNAEALSQYVESSEVRKMLGVSQKTWQTYRDSRAIPFSQFGRKIYVKKSDLDNFMKSHRIESVC